MRGLTTTLHRACALLLLCGGSGSVMASPMLAGDIASLGSGYSASGAPLGAPTELRIDLHGEVGARCKLASPPAIAEKLDFTRSGYAEARFGLDCNTPFNLRVRSGEGGFAAAEARQGLLRSVPYEISVDVETDAGLNALGWCRAGEISDQPVGACPFGTGQGWSSGEATAMDRSGTMRLRWNAPMADKLMFGRYRDTITVEVAVRS